jgi:hypothetical protein
MKISKQMTEHFANEMHNVAKQIKGTENVEEKLFYFSAVFGAAQRVINFEFDDEMLCIHQVTSLAYNQIQQRIVLIKSGQQPTIGLPNNLFIVLQDMVEELAKLVEKGESTHALLEKMLVLSYATSGNGFYLFQKGELKI